MLLAVPLKWLLAWLLAAAVHEISHILAIRVLGGRVLAFRVHIAGAAIEISPMSPGRELLSALAGPAGGLLLLPLGRWLPMSAACALLQSAWNLLPVYPLDGGRALGCLLSLIFGEDRGMAAARWVGRTLLVCLSAVAIYGFFCQDWGLLPLLAVAALSLRAGREG